MDASRYDLVALRAVLEPPVLGFADLHTHCDLDLVCPACLAFADAGSNQTCAHDRLQVTGS